ncbi:MAG: PAS domain-containing protein [Salinarimonas sp.]
MSQEDDQPAAARDERGVARAIVDTIRQPLLVLTPTLRVETANQAFHAAFGTTPADTDGRPIDDLGDGQWAVPELRRLLEEVLPTGKEIADFRVTHDFPTLGRRVMLLSAQRMILDRYTERILVAISDVTEAERVRIALAGQTEYLEKVIDASRDALLVLGFDLRVHAANDTFYRVFQADRAETLGHAVFDLGNGQWDIPELRRLLETILPENASFDDFEVAHDFRTIGSKVMVLNARRIDHLQLILLAIEDVTERRESRSALARSEARFRALVEASSQAVWETDADGVVRDDSASWRALTGQTLEQWLGNGWLDAVHPEDRDTASRRWREAVAAGLPIESEFRLRASDGSWRWTNVRAAPLRDEAGAVVRWVGMNLDLDARRRAEEDRELLLGELSHRVKNLLAVIRSLANRTVEGSTAESYRSTLLGRIDALSRAHTLALESEWRGVDLATLAEGTLEPYGRGGRAVSIRIEGEPVALSPRATMTIGLVLHELATNAAKYGALSVPTGRVAVTWRTEPTQEDGTLVHLCWEESGGPPVVAPKTPSFGTRMIERVFAHELAGGARLAFRPEGVRLDARFRPT